MKLLPQKNHPDLQDRIRYALQKDDLIPEGTGVLVAVSGGPDSMALLALLAEIATFPIRAVHLNHALRPGDCDLDEQLIADYCRHRNIKLYRQVVDVKGLAEDQGTGLEAAGRQARYAFFDECRSEWRRESNSPADVVIAVAHHLDDQAETLLLHVGRGCGLDGFTGMKPKTGSIIRPLLAIRRTELMNYLTMTQTPWRQDQTNHDLFTLRNRLRHQVLPIWQTALGYDPAVVLARTAERVREDQDLLEEMTLRAWKFVLCSQALGMIEWDLARFREQPPALQNRLLRLAWRSVRGEINDLEWRHIKLARDLLSDLSHARAHMDWPQGVGIDLNRKTVRFTRADSII